MSENIEYLFQILLLTFGVLLQKNCDNLSYESGAKILSKKAVQQKSKRLRSSLLHIQNILQSLIENQ